MSKIKNLTVMGSGVLGGQIAWHSAFKGKSVTVLDITGEALDGRANTARFTSPI